MGEFEASTDVSRVVLSVEFIRMPVLFYGHLFISQELRKTLLLLEKDIDEDHTEGHESTNTAKEVATLHSLT